jgi:Apea-like HEPN
MEEWVSRLDAHYDKNIRVAVLRTVSAIGERGLWDDALIDFVIALENLFGGPGPKLELRISTALALVLGETEDERAAIAARSKRVYHARSRLVHGDELPDDGSHPREDAERLALDALRSLFTTYTHLIPDRKARRNLWKISKPSPKSRPACALHHLGPCLHGDMSA